MANKYKKWDFLKNFSIFELDLHQALQKYAIKNTQLYQWSYKKTNFSSYRVVNNLTFTDIIYMIYNNNDLKKYQKCIYNLKTVKIT